MTDVDVRWKQRLANFRRALEQLEGAVELAGQRELSDLECLGLIQAFEFNHELAWNVMKDYFAWQGNTAITGSRDAVREAFGKGLIEDGEGWMEMIHSRNLTAHAYNEKVAREISDQVVERYCVLFRAFATGMGELEARA